MDSFKEDHIATPRESGYPRTHFYCSTPPPWYNTYPAYDAVSQGKSLALAFALRLQPRRPAFRM